MTKEKLKDELKDRISMALKDTILQQGFEIICKNLAELEKNAELNKNSQKQKQTMTKCFGVKMRLFPKQKK